MKSIAAALLAHYQQGELSVAYALKVTRLDTEVFALTSLDQDAEIDGVNYRSDPGLEVTNIQISGGPQVGNLELKALHDNTVFTKYDVLSGLWRNASFILYRFNHRAVGSPQPQDVETVLVGIIGDVRIETNYFVAELRDLRQYLQQPIGSPSTKTCRYRLGDGRCGVNLAGNAPGSPTVALTRSGTVTSVVSAQKFSDYTATQPNDWFGAGELTWLTGANAGITIAIKSFEQGSPAAGLFTLYIPMLASISPGDTYTAVAGCRHRLEQDCRDKFGNVLNFGGEPHRPGVDQLSQSVTPDV